MRRPSSPGVVAPRAPTVALGAVPYAVIKPPAGSSDALGTEELAGAGMPRTSGPAPDRDDTALQSIGLRPD